MKNTESLVWFHTTLLVLCSNVLLAKRYPDFWVAVCMYDNALVCFVAKDGIHRTELGITKFEIGIDLLRLPWEKKKNSTASCRAR